MYKRARSSLRSLTLLVCFAAASCFASGWAEQAKIAVAANFKPAMEKLEPVFEQETGHQLLISYGSTGQFYAQIEHGAPFHLFLAADRERPRKLAEAGNRPEPQTYALGRLALWSPRQSEVDRNTLELMDFRFLAIANEAQAPYGEAALAVIEGLGLRQSMAAKLVRGNNVAQAFVFIQTGNADLGFVALSQIRSLPQQNQGSYWLPADGLYPAIRQDALLLERGVDNPAALAFFRFLFSDAARALIQDAGYELP